jgi:CHASE2 domain-containing sensor protein
MKNSGNTGIGFFGLLTIVFVVLKLTGYIAWSWFWVFSPIIIPSVTLVILALGIYLWYRHQKKKVKQALKEAYPSASDDELETLFQMYLKSV